MLSTTICVNSIVLFAVNFCPLLCGPRGALGRVYLSGQQLLNEMTFFDIDRNSCTAYRLVTRWFTLALCRSSSTVKVIDDSSKSQGEFTGGNSLALHVSIGQTPTLLNFVTLRQIVCEIAVVEKLCSMEK